MNVSELIISKRNGHTLDDAAIEALIADYVAGRIPDYQLAAFLMAVYFKGMSAQETAGYTRAMIDSGERFDLSAVPGVKVDKHSTGGVGDKVSLPLIAVVAAANVPVPMMSGRGLGHTGGTLDKLESIPGYTVALDAATATKQLAEIGCFLIGQTERIAPADKKLYALRDVTGTVESIPLICGSILSKKVAAGVEALVMDVKTGTGAFMQTLDDSRNLARQLVAIGTAVGLDMGAYITDMNQPLGVAIGNAIEVRESIDCLNGAGPADLREIVLTFAAEMIRVGGRASTFDEAKTLAAELIATGKAREKFGALIAAQKGNPDVLENYDLLPLADGTASIQAAQSGFVSAFDTRRIGLACNALGAGRQAVTDTVDHGVGIESPRKIGEAIDAGDELFRVYHRHGRGLDEALAALNSAATIADAPPPARPLIVERITAATATTA